MQFKIFLKKEVKYSNMWGNGSTVVSSLTVTGFAIFVCPGGLICELPLFSSPV